MGWSQSRKIPPATKKPNPWTTTTEVLHPRSPCSQETPWIRRPSTKTRESPLTALKTQCSQKYINKDGKDNIWNRASGGGGGGRGVTKQYRKSAWCEKKTLFTYIAWWLDTPQYTVTFRGAVKPKKLPCNGMIHFRWVMSYCLTIYYL